MIERNQQGNNMKTVSHAKLIEEAASVIQARKVGDRLIGDVGCALLTAGSHIYRGVCLDLPSGIGFCAEHSAIAGMVTAGESRIAKIVAVWKDEHDALHILSPCGRCRELIRQIDPANMDTEVILDHNRSVSLDDLLPYADWYQKQ